MLFSVNNSFNLICILYTSTELFPPHSPPRALVSSSPIFIYFSPSPLPLSFSLSIPLLIECKGQTLWRRSSSSSASASRVRLFISDCNVNHMAAFESPSRMALRNMAAFSAFHTPLHRLVCPAARRRHPPPSQVTVAKMPVFLQSALFDVYVNLNTVVTFRNTNIDTVCLY